MPSQTLKCASMGQENTQTDSLGGWEEGVTVDGGGKVTQERMIDAVGQGSQQKKE